MSRMPVLVLMLFKIPYEGPERLRARVGVPTFFPPKIPAKNAFKR